MTNRERIWKRAKQWMRGWQGGRSVPTPEQAYLAAWQAAMREVKKRGSMSWQGDVSGRDASSTGSSEVQARKGDAAPDATVPLRGVFAIPSERLPDILDPAWQQTNSECEESLTNAANVLIQHHGGKLSGVIFDLGNGFVLNIARHRPANRELN